MSMQGRVRRHQLNLKKNTRKKGQHPILGRY